MLYFDDWQNEYSKLIDLIAKTLRPEQIAWISLGSLRFTPGLKKIVNDRFPKSKIMSGELYPSSDGKIRYFKPIREEMYQFLTKNIEAKLEQAPYYLCMETKSVWQNTLGNVPAHNGVLEKKLAAQFRFPV